MWDIRIANKQSIFERIKDPNTIWEVTPTNRPFTLFLLLDEPIAASEAPGKLRITLTFMKGGTHMPQTADVLAAACPGGLAQIQALAPFSPLALIPAAQRSDWQKRSLVLDWREAQGEVDPGMHETWWHAQDQQFSLQKNVLRCSLTELYHVSDSESG